MTPHMQQAVRLLLLSNNELISYIEEQLEMNPFLERDVQDISDSNPEFSPGLENDQNEPMREVSERELLDFNILQSTTSNIPDNSPSYISDYDPIANLSEEKTLSDHLRGQLFILISDNVDQQIGIHLIDGIDENGYLCTTIDDVCASLGVTAHQAANVLDRLQSCSPNGVFARDLKECLSLQLRSKGLLSKPMCCLLDNLELLAKHDHKSLSRIVGVELETLRDLVSTIQSLSPKPGMAFGSEIITSIEPDVTIKKTKHGGWTIELNTEALPRVLINKKYITEICGPNADKETRSFVAEFHESANWLIRSMEQRAISIMKVATEIVKQQEEFLNRGVEFLRPLNMRTVADAINMHESTVSRVTTNKYIDTPRGIFELKHFFSASLPSVNGIDVHSASSVKHKIKTLILEETLKDIRTDDKIAGLLKMQGIDVARRTVAKYREELKISSTFERRNILKSPFR